MIDNSLIEKGSEFIDCILQKVSSNYNAIIISTFMNKFALHFLLQGAQGKPHYVNLKTSTIGILRGVIPILSEEDSLFHHSIPYTVTRENIVYHAINRDGLDLWERGANIQKNDYRYRILADQEGKIITSDLDLLFISTTIEDSICFNDLEYGWVTKLELNIIKDINSAFNIVVSDNIKNHNNSSRLVSHGPFNRCQKLSVQCIKFPVKIYSLSDVTKVTENKEIFGLEELFVAIEECRSRGYKFYFPEKWAI